MSENFNIASQGNTPNWDLNTSGSADVNISKSTGFNLESTLSASEGGTSTEAKLYVNASFKPGLTSPINDNPSLGDATIDQLFNFDKIVQAIMQLNGTPPPGSPGEEFANELAKMPVDDPEILAMAEKQGIPPGQLQYNVQVSNQELFNGALKGLPDDVANKLRFAHNNPEAAKNLSPELKAQLKTIESSILQSVKKEYGFSQEWQGIPEDNTYFNQKISAQFDTDFETELETLKDSGQITEKEALQIRSLHYQVGDKATADPNLVKILNDIQTSVAANIRNQYGADAEWTPKADVAYHAAVLDGRFQTAFETELNKFKPPLSADSKAQVIKSFANPDDPSIPDNIKQIAKTIQTAATQVVIDEFGLPPTWQTTATTAVSLKPQASMIQSALATAKEVQTHATELVNSLPDSAEKISYLDFLKTVGKSISQLQELSYALQCSDSLQAKGLSAAKMDTAMNQIDIQQKKADEAKEKMQKMAALGPLKAIFEWLIKIIMLIIAFMLGPIMFAIVLTYIVDSTQAEVRKTTSLFQQMFNSVEDKAGKGAAIAINMIITFGISMGNPLLIMQMFTNDSRCIQNFVAICGGDKAAQEMTVAIFGMILQMAIMFPLIILSGGGVAPVAAAEALKEALDISLKAATQATKAASIAFQIMMASLEVTKNAVTINNNVIKAQLEYIKANAESYVEEAQALIAILKKIIQKLLDMMNTRSELILDLSNFQAKKYNDASAVLTELYS